MRGEAVCPGEETLVRFLAGRAPESERDHIAEHVDACSTCAAVLALPASATPIAFRGGHGGPLLIGSLRAGSVLAGRYRILHPLGAGGMGEVYEAFDLSLNEAVALKTVRPTIADNPRAVDLLKSEVQLARRVTHPNVCRIFDFGVGAAEGAAGEATPFLTMELLRGTTLARALRDRGPLGREITASVAHQIAAGLAAAHRVGVIHKDLKSENIILTEPPDGTARAFITDFGLAATRTAVEQGPRPVTQFSGTPGYVAPERMAGGPATEASDVFALGIVLMDLATGMLPARRLREGSALAVREPALLALARRCQAAVPGARPRLPEVLNALRRLEQGPIAARARALGWGAGATLAVAAAVAAVVLWRAPSSDPRAGTARVDVATALVPAPRTLPTAGAATTDPAPLLAARAPSTPAAAAVRARRAPRARAASQTPAAPAVAVAASSIRNAAGTTPATATARDLRDEPIRTLAPTLRSVSRDDAPIVPPSHAR